AQARWNVNASAAAGITAEECSPACWWPHEPPRKKSHRPGAAEIQASGTGCVRQAGARGSTAAHGSVPGSPQKGQRCHVDIKDRSPIMTTETLTDATKEAIDEAVAAALGDAYDCTRVWSAWSY